MPTDSTDTLSAISNMKEDFVSNIILGIIFLVLIILIIYLIYIHRLENSECSYMNNLYSAIDGHIRSIDQMDPDCSGNLYDYYIKTAYNACSGGGYKNDFVNICNLKSVLKEGVRGLDFEVYSIDNNPVVATSTSDSYYVKETFNSVNFADVMSTIANYAFTSGTAPNYSDPIIIHLRIKSNNQTMYTNLASIFQSYEDIMLGKEYSFESNGNNLGRYPLVNFMNKIVLIVDKINNAYLDNPEFLEYVNLTSNSIFMRAFNYYDVKNNPDINELTEFNKRGMTIVFPDSGVNPVNPSGMLCRESGCQMVAMRYQYVDNYLEENAVMFDRCGYAFCLKPQRLRYVPVTIPDPVPQKPEYSYATRNASTDYYNFNF
jgi:hypothetical protein